MDDSFFLLPELSRPRAGGRKGYREHFSSATAKWQARRRAPPGMLSVLTVGGTPKPKGRTMGCWRAWVGGLLLGSFGLAAPVQADSVCGPGKRLVDNQWACAPYTATRRPSAPSGYNGNRVAAGLAVGGILMSLVESLASGTRITDDAGPAPSVHDNKPLTQDELRAHKQGWHGTQSRTYNRKGIALQRAGDYDGARRAFNKAADEAREAGNADEAAANWNNAQIADALHWFHEGYQSEKAGKIVRANLSYKRGMEAAGRADRPDLEEKLRGANDRLLKSGDGDLIQNDDICDMINGEYSCRVRTR